MKYIIFGIFAAMFYSACGSNDSPETAAATTPEPAEATVRLTKDQLQKSGIDLGTATEKSIAATLTANGTVAVLPEDKASLSAKISGRIEQFFIHEGQHVKKGQALMSIGTSQIFDIQQAYLQAKADLVFLEKELERQKTLSSQQVGASKNYEEVQSKYARAQGDLQTAAAKLRYLDIDLNGLANPAQLQLAKQVTVYAPISGNITTIPVNLGSSVGEGTVLCNIIGLDDLHAHVEIFARDIALVREKQKAEIRFPNSTQPPILTEVEYISYEMDPETRTYSAHIHLPAPRNNAYLPGMPVVAEIHTTENPRGLALPEAAVLPEGDKVYCFVLEQQQGEVLTFKKVSFTPTRQNGGWVGVPDGLLEGKSVVLKGANLVDGQMRQGEMNE
jgi:membrane fusion protein, heavy metal efflux system